MREWSSRCDYCTCDAGTNQCKQNKRIYIGLLVVVVIYVTLLLFNEDVVDPALEGLDSIGVEGDNTVHVIYFLLCPLVIFLPHPFMVVGLFWGVVGYFFKYFPGLIIFLFGNIIGVLITFGIGRYFRMNGFFKVRCCFNPTSESFSRFRAAIEKDPRKMIFLFQFWIMPQQYNLLLAPVFSDLPLEVTFFPSLTGSMITSVPALIIGCLATDLADSFDVNNNSTDVITLITIFTILTVSVWIYSTIILQRAMSEALGTQDLNPLQSPSSYGKLEDVEIPKTEAKTAGLENPINEPVLLVTKIDDWEDDDAL